MAAGHATAPIHVERSYRRDDFRSDGGLIARKQDGFRADDLLDGPTLGHRGLHRDYRLGFFGLFGAGHKQCSSSDEQREQQYPGSDARVVNMGRFLRCDVLKGHGSSRVITTNPHI